MENQQELQKIIIETIESIAKNTILNTNYLTLIKGQISYVDIFNNYYNFTCQKEEYTGFSITGEKYEVGDLVYILKLNNQPETKQMIISKVNSYSNLDIELSINETINELKNYIDQADTKEKSLSIIGNTVFTLNDDLTITPEELTLSAQKTGNIENIKWFIDDEQQPQDDLQRLVLSNRLVENKDSITVRVEDSNNSSVKDEITVIRALKADTKLDFDLGLDSILLQKNEQGIIDYSKAIIIPRVLSDGVDVTSQGWEFTHKVENGALTLVRQEGQYRILEMKSDIAKISFFAKKNGNMYLQKVIYAILVFSGQYNLNITLTNQNFIIPMDYSNLTKEYTIETTISATRGTKTIKINKSAEVPTFLDIPANIVENENGTITFSFDIPSGKNIEQTSGEIILPYLVENEEKTSNILWTTIQDGSTSKEYRLEIEPKNIVRNGDGTLTPPYIKIKSKVIIGEKEDILDVYFRVYQTLNNEDYILRYNSPFLNNRYTYNIENNSIKALKVEMLSEDEELLATEYVYVNINSDDFVETTDKTVNNNTAIEKIDGQIKLIVEKNEELETTVTDLGSNTEQKFSQINKQYSNIEQKVNSVTTTVSNQSKEIETINGEIVAQKERLTKAEEKITDDAIISTVTGSEKWTEVSDKADSAFNNSKAILLKASSSAFTKTEEGMVYTPVTITVTPQTKSVSFGKYQYCTGSNMTYKDIVSGQHGFTVDAYNILTIRNDSDLFTEDNNSIIIKGLSELDTFSDTVTIVKMAGGAPGDDSYGVILGNESITLSCSNDGLTLEQEIYNIPVYTYLGLDMVSNIISIAELPTGMSAQVTNGSSSKNGIIELTIEKDSNLGNKNNGVIDVNITILGKLFTKKITWAKSIAGNVGEQGTPGIPGRTYFLEPTTVVIKKEIDNTLLPGTVTFAAYYRDGTSENKNPYLGRFKIEEDNGDGYVIKYTSSIDEKSKTYTPTTSAKTIKCTLYTSGGTTNALDTQTVAIISDAEAAIKSDTPPEDTNVLWFDTISNLLKYYNGEEWVVANDYAGDINDMKQQITTEYTTAITQLKDSLTLLVQELQTTTTDNVTAIEELASQIQQNATSISLVTSSVKKVTDSLTGMATKEEISQWARFEGGVLELGASNSPFAVKLSNTELGFYQSGKRIAYLSNQQLNISQAVVMQQINLGLFQFISDPVLGLIIK